MDGRAVVHHPPQRQSPAQDDEDDDVVDQSDDLNADSEQDEHGDSGEDMVLSKEDFDVLQAFHRLVPLPALTSKILRVLCDEDLQVADAHENDAQASSDEVSRPYEALRVSATPHSVLAKHSPLTRRLSNNPMAKATGSPVGASTRKPHRAVDLATQTPRTKRLTAIASGDDRVG